MRRSRAKPTPPARRAPVHDARRVSQASEKAAFEAALRDHQNGNLDAAIAGYRAIVDRAPEIADPWHLLGVAVYQKGDGALARQLIETAIGLNGAVADYHSNLGMVLLSLRDVAAAEQSLRQAVRLTPTHAKALANLAGALRGRGLFDEALDLARRAVAAAPDDPETQNNLGNALKDAMQPAEAVASYDRALALKPDFALAHWNRALAMLTLGDYAQGFDELAWRWRWSGFPTRPRDYTAPLWTGQDIAGKTLFLYPEQGLGDAIQFVRYAALARALGGHVIIEAPGGLAPLAARSKLADQVVAPGEVVPHFDLHAPFLDLPHLFATTLETIPAITPYLVADAAHVQSLRARTAGRGGLRVGFNWTGNPLSPVERFRNLPITAAAPLARLSGIDWIGLQKGSGGDAVPRPVGLDLIETGEGPLDETAALIASLDLVVSTDTAVAHLAGALGVPTWLMLHHAPDWRWQLGRADSPWYPSMRLFRQANPGDWAPVVGAVAEALSKRV